MSMQTLTRDVDAAAVAGNSDAYSLRKTNIENNC